MSSWNAPTITKGGLDATAGGGLDATVELPGSKSITNRALVLAALADDEPTDAATLALTGIGLLRQQMLPPLLSLLPSRRARRLPKMLDGLSQSHMHVFIVLRSLWNCHISFRRQRCFTIDDLLYTQ